MGAIDFTGRNNQPGAGSCGSLPSGRRRIDEPAARVRAGRVEAGSMDVCKRRGSATNGPIIQSFWSRDWVVFAAAAVC